MKCKTYFLIIFIIIILNTEIIFFLQIVLV